MSEGEGEKVMGRLDLPAQPLWSWQADEIERLRAMPDLPTMACSSAGR